VVIVVEDLNTVFDQLSQELSCDQETKAYIAGVFSKYRTTTFDLSKQNITLTYAQAHFQQDFLTFQTIGDWLLFAESLFPESLHSASEDYFFNLGRLSYGSCYRLINRRWRLYEELSDQFIPLTYQMRETLHKL
jgi:hypothetical protein